jgi:glyoxylase-like metal-dependent hydrolase (beta-lactamase superfamily II)
VRQIVPGIFTWSWLSPRHNYNFNGYAFKSAEGLIVIDPAIMEGSDLELLQKLGTPAHIFLTNKDHERMAYELRDRFGCKIYIHKEDAPPLKQSPDHTFDDGDILPGNLRAINISNNKSPGETALLLPVGNGILFIGDSIIGWPPGEFSLLPAFIYKNAQIVKFRIKVLLDHPFDTVLVGDGECVLKGGKEAIGRFLDRRDVHLTLPVQR